MWEWLANIDCHPQKKWRFREFGRSLFGQCELIVAGVLNRHRQSRCRQEQGRLERVSPQKHLGHSRVITSGLSGPGRMCLWWNIEKQGNYKIGARSKYQWRPIHNLEQPALFNSASWITREPLNLLSFEMVWLGSMGSKLPKMWPILRKSALTSGCREVTYLWSRYCLWQGCSGSQWQILEQK